MSVSMLQHFFENTCDEAVNERNAESAPIEAYARAGADDVAVILFTSGTEGRAKGVMLTHNNICANQKGYVAMTHLSSGDTMLMPVPVAHATGLMYGVTIPFMTGMKSVLLERFNPEKSLELIEKHRLREWVKGM